MNDRVTFTIPHESLETIATLMRSVVTEALAERHDQPESGFLDVSGAAAYLASTATAIRALIKREAIPHYKAPNGRLLFDRNELDAWARSSPKHHPHP